MRYLLYICFVAIGWSCYDDKGNYDYREINEVEVLLEKQYVVTSMYTDFRIEPEYKQSLRENSKNLTYIWLEMKDGTKEVVLDTLGTDPVLDLEINGDVPGFRHVRFLRLLVTDEISGLCYIADTKLQVAKSFYKSWMLLHQSAEGTAKLAAVEYIGGEVRFRKDAYGDESGKQFRGKPLRLGVFDRFYSDYYDSENGYIMNGFAIVTDREDESGIYCQWKKFRQMGSFDKMVYPADMDDFNISKVSFLGGSDQAIQMCLSGGKLYQSSYAGKFYKVHVNPEIEGEINLSLVGKEASVPILYDRAGHRFFYYWHWGVREGSPYPVFDPARENPEEYMLNPIPFRKGNVTEVDPNALTKEQDMLYIGRGYGDRSQTRCVYAIGLGSDKCYLYEFNNGNAFLYDNEYYGPTFKAYRELDIPKGMTKESRLTSSRLYNGIFFYTSGNVVYRYDSNTGDSREIYRHDGAVKAICLDFAKREDTNLEDDPFMGNNWTAMQQMGIAFEMSDSTYEFVVLHLDNTGKVSLDDSIYSPEQVYRGLGKIVDIAFV